MPHPLTFDIIHRYNDSLVGIEIPTALRFSDEVVLCQAKVDPGAQVCLFKRDLGETLGLDIGTGHYIELDSIGGTIAAYGHYLVLETLGMEFESVVYFAATYNLRRNLLGREGWLQKVRLGIVDYETTLYLSPYQK